MLERFLPETTGRNKHCDFLESSCHSEVAKFGKFGTTVPIQSPKPFGQ